MTNLANQEECTAALFDVTPNAAVVANLGVASYTLINIADRARNFYLTGAMGSTTPIGLGMALGTDEQVTVLDGDGSLLMGLGALATVGEYGTPNLTVVVWNNSMFETTGGQPTLAETIDFAAVAHDCGVESWQTDSTESFREAYEAAVGHDGSSLVVCDVVAETPVDYPSIDYAHSYVKHRFRESLTDN